jgi:BirA family biotin operon repressor/biotin-[acetyl-CoA-carboxylase] ligase
VTDELMGRSSRFRIDWVDRVGSTNAELVTRATADPEAWPHLSALATTDQTAGRGRLDRVWSAPPGTALALSVVVRPKIRPGAFGWLSLLAGVAMSRALRDLGAPATLKWPNDVRIGGRKVCGILSELLPDLSGAVIGSGVNIALAERDLPVVTATSLQVEGIVVSADDVARAYLPHLAELARQLEAAGGDARAAGLVRQTTDMLDTVGREVRVLLPDGSTRHGTATGIDDDGRLRVEQDGRSPLIVAAGEVTHLRY